MSHASHGPLARRILLGRPTRLGRRSLLAGAVCLLVAAAQLLAPATAVAGAHAAPPPTRVPVSVPVPIPIPVGTTRQVITVQARGSYATVTAWQLSPLGRQLVLTTSAARIGAHGLADGATRRQGTLTTPTGTYTLTRGFGNGPAPLGTRLPYHRVTADDWWVEDPRSPYYNTMRTARQGGFPLTEAGARGSEHLVEYPVQYHNALVIDFNMHPAVPGRGAGIFLHDLGPTAGATAGCVAVPAGVLARLLRWIDPAAHPVITISADLDPGSRGSAWAPRPAARPAHGTSGRPRAGG